jgi:hypothetical protein
MANHRNAKFLRALFNRFKDGRWYVVGMDINRHGMIRNYDGEDVIVFQQRDRKTTRRRICASRSIPSWARHIAP